MKTLNPEFETMDDFLGRLPLDEQNRLKAGAKVVGFEIQIAHSKNNAERIQKIMGFAACLFGGTEKANEWLGRKNPALGATPLSVLETEGGINEVKKLLTTIGRTQC